MLLLRRQIRKKLSLFKTERKLSNVMKSEILEFLILVLTKKDIAQIINTINKKKHDKPEVFCRLKESTGQRVFRRLIHSVQKYLTFIQSSLERKMKQIQKSERLPLKSHEQYLGFQKSEKGQIISVSKRHEEGSCGVETNLILIPRKTNKQENKQKP